MVRKKIDFFWYDTDDIVGKCRVCGKDAYNMPIFIRQMEITEQQRKDFNAGLWGMSFCPYCNFVDTWELKTQ